MSCELGCGPRDGLMSALSRITNKPIKLIRAVIELGAMALGWLLGGFVGVGTFITAIGLGYCFQFSSRLLKLDIVNLKHRNITDDFKYIQKVVFKRKAVES